MTDIDAYAERADELYIFYQPARGEIIIDALSAQPARHEDQEIEISQSRKI